MFGIGKQKKNTIRLMQTLAAIEAGNVKNTPDVLVHVGHEVYTIPAVVATPATEWLKAKGIK